jgi:uncharacterized protein with NRDE domain
VCTLTIAWQVFADTPIVVAANRDELLDRPSRPPEVIAEEPRIVAPTDAEAGGTWIGYNEHGVFVAITNRCAEAAARHVERSVADHEYEGFNLVVADAAAALYFEWDGSLRVENFEPGVHVVVNVGAGGSFVVPPHRPEAGETQATNARQVATALRPEPGERAGEWIDRAREVISDHDYGVCVHRDRFGTRSSSLITIGPEGATYRFADGPPCRTAYRSVETHL